MTWEKVLAYEGDVREIAKLWSIKYDPDLYEDAVHHTYINMYEKLDLSNAESEREYVRGAIWFIVGKFFKESCPPERRHISLEQLCEDGFQVDEKGTPRWPQPDGVYRGDLRDNNE